MTITPNFSQIEADFGQILDHLAKNRNVFVVILVNLRLKTELSGNHDLF